ncbi:MAG: winged helix DNA-binding domain-containing protein [Chloroflexi bacterium]|nr:winged helix DNA-binding domain-containing protein [Chloroflexota bacterium]MYF81564.1 winged helix DNA-binding domain-containing protein [Chloroflexota bacterium]MYI03521.1 winged helix DNA-binding domain-containing protein [Chloroflexota bacterium]
MLELSWSEARRLRIQAQGLGIDRSAEIESAVRAAGAIQAQDRLGMLLGVGTRSIGLTAADVDHARSVERSAVRSWLMRGTLHLVPAADLRWMFDLLGPKMDAKALKRRADLGISDDDHAQVLQFFRDHLSGGGSIMRTEIEGALAAAGLPHAGQAPRHLLRTASMLGVICFGADRDGEETHMLIDDWLPDPGLEPSDPAAELARRYFAAYGPATPADFRWWTGLPAADTRSGFDAVQPELVEVSVEGTVMWMTPEAASQAYRVLAEPVGRVRVVGPFDPYLLGYAKRELGVPDPLLKRINAGGGMIRSCVLIDGRLVGTWDRKRRARGLAATVSAFEPLSDDDQAQLDDEFAEIGRFLETDINWSQALDPAAAKSG